MTQDRALYSRFNARYYGALAAVFGVGAVAAVVFTFLPGATNAPARFGCGVIAAMISVVCTRISRLRVVLRADCLEIVNPFRTFRLPWTEIDNIDTAIFYGWRVRVWTNGKARLAFGLSQFSKFSSSHGPRYDDIDRDAPRWLSRGYAELREFWQSRR